MKKQIAPDPKDEFIKALEGDVGLTDFKYDEILNKTIGRKVEITKPHILIQGEKLTEAETNITEWAMPGNVPRAKFIEAIAHALGTPAWRTHVSKKISARNQVGYALDIILRHLLTEKYQAKPINSWLGSIDQTESINLVDRTRTVLRRVLNDTSLNPWMKQALPKFLEQSFLSARSHVIQEARTTSSKDTLQVIPEKCPWTLAEILDEPT